MNDRDLTYMKRALELARMGAGLVSPNPLVGAVVVKDDRIVGEGYHLYERIKHAEMIAIDSAGDKARGATLYCTLEPCTHYGRTPPCVDSVTKAGIQRVVVAMADPNCRVDGRGIKQLAEAGITVNVGLCAEEAAALNETYLKFIVDHKPFVHLVTYRTSLSESVDRSAREQLERLWSPSAEIQESIRHCDALVVGSWNPQVEVMIGQSLNRPRHRPVVIAGTPEILGRLRNSFGDNQNLKLLALDYEEQDTAVCNGSGPGLFSRLHSALDQTVARLAELQITSVVILPGGSYPALSDWNVVDKITMIDQAAGASDSAGRSVQLQDGTLLGRVHTTVASGIVEVTGYPVKPDADRTHET